MSDVPSPPPSSESRSERVPVVSPIEQGDTTSALEDQVQAASFVNNVQGSDPSAQNVSGSLPVDILPAGQSRQGIDPLAKEMKALDVTTPASTREQIEQSVQKADAQGKHDGAQEGARQESKGRDDTERASADARAGKSLEPHDARSEKGSEHGKTSSSTSERLIHGTEKAVAAVKNLAGMAARAETLEGGSKALGRAARLVEGGPLHAPDAIVRAVNKAVDATQGGLFNLGREHAQKVVGKVEKGAAVLELPQHIAEAREAGLNTKGAAVEAGVRLAGDLVGHIEGKVAAKAFESVVDAGARGLGIAVTAATGNQQERARLSDAAADARLGAPAFYGDVVGDLVATHNLGDAVNRITDAAGDGRLGWAGRLGASIGDHVWSLNHPSR